jgi:hypothetical protein
MLKLLWIPRMDRSSGTIHMQLSDQRTSPVHAYQLLPKCPVFGTFPQSEQTNEDICLGIFVGEESLPSAICGIISTEKFDRLWADTIMDLVELLVSSENKSHAADVPRLLDTGRHGIQRQSPSSGRGRVLADCRSPHLMIRVAWEYHWTSA